MQGLQENFEKKYERFKDYQMDIEKINRELADQLEQMRVEDLDKEKIILCQNEELEILR